MHIITKEWLHLYYGSKSPQQERDTRNWLLRYGKEVPETKLDEWSKWKHLSEYQVNTPDIVDKALGMIGLAYRSELSAHCFINTMRVPGHADAYSELLKLISPVSILELGVGGDSAISTSVFLCYLEKVNGYLISVDRNPLGVTWLRYNNCSFWKFEQCDSVEYLNRMISNDHRFDMVFIDTIHSYSHTMKELNGASKITGFMLMDDCEFEGNDFDDQPGGVKRAIKEWTESNTNWERVQPQSCNNVCLLMRLR
jgi:predicted O-methyltransferase YrrM